MSDKFTFDADIVRQLAELLNETDLNEIEYESDDRRIRVVRHRKEMVVAPVAAAPVATAPVAAAAPIAVVEDHASHPGAVKSPMVGNVYLAAEPTAPNFVKEGDTVKEGQTLVIIEAMKVMNPIKAPRSGVVKKILVENAQPVEYDEALLIIE